MTTETHTTDVVFARSSVEERWGWAKAVSMSGDLVPKGYRNEDGSPNTAKVFVASEYATMLGQHPLVGLTSISVIEGKPTPSPALMSALIREAGHKLRIKTSGTVEGGDFRAEVTLIRKDDPDYPFVSVWTPQRAARAGLCKYEQDPKTKTWRVEARSKYGKVLPWENYTEDLCKRRAISEVGRDGAEDVLHGAHYTAEELGANVNADGEIIDAELVEQDHDGPTVQKVVGGAGSASGAGDAPENAIPNQNRAHNRKTEAPQRDAGHAAPFDKGTADGAPRPGGSRPASKTGPGSADEPVAAATQKREHGDIADMWIERIKDAQTMAELINLRDDVVKRGSVILDYRDLDDHTVDQWFNRRRAELQQAAAGEPETHITDDVAEYDEPLEGLPF